MKLSQEDVGRRYANALYDYALDQGAVESIKDELAVLKQVIDDNPKLVTVLDDPLLNINQKNQILTELKAKFSKTIQDFLQIIFEYQRFSAFLAIIKAYDNRFDEENKLGHGVVTTAIKMNDQQMTKMNDTYAKKFGLKQMSLKNVVDQEILGGAIIVADGKKIDGSIKTKITELKRSLAQNM